jgi:hypothetical protein
MNEHEVLGYVDLHSLTIFIGLTLLVFVLYGQCARECVREAPLRSVINSRKRHC